MDAVNKIRLYNRILAGALAGIYSGVIMLLALCLGHLLIGRPFYLPLKLIAGSLMGGAALLPSLSNVAISIGILVHFSVAAAAGALFGCFSRSHSRTELVLLGLAYGLGIWSLIQFFLLPLGINLTLGVRMSPLVFLASSLVYGMSLVLILPAEARLLRKEATEYAEHSLEVAAEQMTAAANARRTPEVEIVYASRIPEAEAQSDRLPRTAA